MEYKKITENDLVGKGVVGQPDTPALSALEMQNKVEEVVRDVVIPHFNELVGALTENGKPVQSGDVMQMRIGENGDLQISADGVQWLNVADKALEGKADKDNSYTKDQLYTKEETDAKLDKKAEADKVYTKEETDKAIGDKLAEVGAGDMRKSVYDTDNDGMVDNAKKLDGHEADYFSTFRDCSNVPFNEIASGKGAFLVNWDSANSPNANKLFGISDGWTAIAMSYTGEIYITTIEKTSWEAMSLSKSGGTFTSDAVHFNNYHANVGSYYGSNTDHNAHLATIGEDGLISQICVSNDMKVFAQQWKDGQYIKGATIMTDAGGTFTGNVQACTENFASGLRNIWIADGSWTGVNTSHLQMIRK